MKYFLIFFFLLSCQESKSTSAFGTGKNPSLEAKSKGLPDDFSDLKKENKAGCTDKNSKEEIEKQLKQLSTKPATLQGKKDTDCVVK